MKANARLIAAAPELLDALQDILPLVQELRDMVRTAGHGHLLNSIEPGRVQAARAAIAKATGEA